MAGGGGRREDHDPLSVGSYSRLLLSDDVDDLDAQNCFNFTPSFSSSEQSAPKMLCFGDDDHFNGDKCDLFFDEITAKIAQKTAGITCSDSSSASSTTTINTTSTVSTTTNVSSLTKSNKKKKPLGAGAVNNSDPVGNSGMANGAPVGKQRNCKRTKSADDSTEATTGRHAKISQVKKEKLGERVIALQQLVSPFGKTDTASVLHEAMGYIRFLQDQVQVLCSPYLQRLPSSAHLLEKGGEEGQESESRKDLRGKGLCLVPIELTVHVAETNGADFWSPAMVNKLSSHQ